VRVTVQYQVQPLSGLGITSAFNVSSTAQFIIAH
jgi:hypothetical protein